MTGPPSSSAPSSGRGPARLALAPGVWIARADLRLQCSRSRGPGGQNVNKLSTRVELWMPLARVRGLSPDAADRLRALAGSRLTAADEIHIWCEEHRTQQANRAAAFGRLRQLVAMALVRPRPRRPTRPTAASRRRRRRSKQRRAEVKAMRRNAPNRDMP